MISKRRFRLSIFAEEEEPVKNSPRSSGVEGVVNIVSMYRSYVRRLGR